MTRSIDDPPQPDPTEHKHAQLTTHPIAPQYKHRRRSSEAADHEEEEQSEEPKSPLYWPLKPGKDLLIRWLPTFFAPEIIVLPRSEAKLPPLDLFKYVNSIQEYVHRWLQVIISPPSDTTHKNSTHMYTPGSSPSPSSASRSRSIRRESARC